MMLEGELLRWNDAKGFGFIRGARGQPDVFLHISALPPGVRPVVGDCILFTAVTQPGAKGPRAQEAAVKGRQSDPAAVRQGRRPSDRSERPSTPTARPERQRDRQLRLLGWSPAVVLVLLLAGFCLVGAAVFVPVSPIPLLLYLVVSPVAFVLYGKDKYRAMTGAWRVSEQTLHFTEALGGWPGAFVAQRTMRHKTAKADYQVVFWLIVAAHVGFWGLWFLSPETLAPLLGKVGLHTATLNWTKPL